MATTSSVSKGVFIFKNGFISSPTKIKSKRKSLVNIENDNIYSSQLWYQSYKNLWVDLENKIQYLNNELFSNILSNLIRFIKTCYQNTVTEIPAAALLMGINMPDHSAQFITLSEKIQKSISPHVVILHTKDCSSLKLFVENMVSKFVNDEDEADSDSETEISTKKFRKSLCTFSLLTWWYNKKYPSPSGNLAARESVNKSLIVILPEFESFAESVLQDFILICGSYINVLPIIVIFGVATSLSAVHKTLPYHVSSKLNIQVFKSQSSTDYLNNILNNVLLSENCPFHLGGKMFTLFTDIFLFYDFSVKGFIQNFKFAMLEHYCHGNATALCTSPEMIDSILNQFDHEDFESVRQLMSFRAFVESHNFSLRVKLIEDDNFFKIELKHCVLEFHQYIYSFHILLNCLHILVVDLPNAPLGKQYREIYAISISQNVFETPEYDQCMQLLTFLSKDDLQAKISSITTILDNALGNKKNYSLAEVLCVIKTFDFDDYSNYDSDETQSTQGSLTTNMNRAQLKKELLKMSKSTKPLNKYERFRVDFLSTLTEFFKNYLVSPVTKPFHEIFFFNHIHSVKNHIIGSHRAAIHTALNNPHNYLKCACCKLQTESTISSSFPDLSIVYKLHLECGKFINMYDWLQAFAIVVQPTDEDEEERIIKPELQARFTRAVAELEFLGFIKSSKRKTDHVQRLTWGGC